eukprot:scaffold29955_cov129-Isochrysis_galbana.AAC.3
MSCRAKSPWIKHRVGRGMGIAGAAAWGWGIGAQRASRRLNRRDSRRGSCQLGVESMRQVCAKLKLGQRGRGRPPPALCAPCPS